MIVRCEIIGNIASGKTTLVNLMSQSITGVLENFQENPFWQSFYQSPELYSFETELTFTLQHYHQIKNNLYDNTNFICDFSLYLDRSYADVTLKTPRKNIYLNVLDELIQEVGYPDLLIYLKCPENSLLDRIQARGRINEKKITLNYLQAVASSIENNIKSFSQQSELIILNSEDLDVAQGNPYMDKIINTLTAKLAN